MIKQQKKGCIYEQFPCLFNSAVYPNSSDINELCEIVVTTK